MTIKAEIEPREHNAKYDYVHLILSEQQWVKFDVPIEYSRKLVDAINNAFDPNEPAGEWWVVEDDDGIEIHLMCGDVKLLSLPNYDIKPLLQQIVRDHNRKYAPDDVEVAIKVLEAVVDSERRANGDSFPHFVLRKLVDDSKAIIAKLKGEYAYITGEDIAETMPPKQGEA